MTADWDRLRAELRAAGVAGVEEVGRFVNNTSYFEPPRFDERAAAPVLIEALSWAVEPDVVTAVATHLGRPWNRPSAFEPLVAAFLRWSHDLPVGWALGDALATVATAAHLDQLFVVALDTSHGRSRQMIVDSLWRYRKDARVQGVLQRLVDDPDVVMHALSALRRVVGPDEVKPYLARVAAGDSAAAPWARRKLRALNQAATPKEIP